MKKLFAGVFLLLNVSNAAATLIDRGNGLIYDSDQNLTWLQDANYAKTSGYATDNENTIKNYDGWDINANGGMGWDAAMAWVTGLTFGGFSDWRLASVTDVGDNGCTTSNSGYGGAAGTDCDYNTDTSLSELAYMFHKNLGNNSRYDTSRMSTSCTYPNYCLENTSADDVDILNLRTHVYWSGTEYAPYNTNHAWVFNTLNGSQSFYNKNHQFSVWAVRDGDVGAVPEPSALLLLGAGLVGLGFVRRKKQH